MKKYFVKFMYSVLVIALVLNGTVFAAGETDESKSDLLEPIGVTMSTEEFSKWFATYQSEQLVRDLIEDNYAFVAGSNRVWTKNKVEVMTKETKMSSDFKFMIPADFVKATFGLSVSGDYVAAESVVSNLGYRSFIDPRGFLMIGSAETFHVNNLPGSGYSYYTDYYTVSDAIGKITWEDKEFTDAERMDYIKRWQCFLTFPEGEEAENMDFIDKAYVAAKTVEKKLNLDYNGDGLFTDLKLKDLDTGGAAYKNNLRSSFSNLQTMAIGYVSAGREDAELKANILAGFKYLYEKYYTLLYKMYGENGSSWPVYQFDIPFMFGNALVLMYDDVSEEDMKKYTDSIFDHAPEPTLRTASRQYGAEYSTNRAWKCFSFFNAAVLANDTKRMNYAMKYVNQVFEWNMSRKYKDLVIPLDGFYDDGSMVFHNSIAYNLGYGSSYIDLIAEMKALTHGTPFDIENVFNYKNIYKLVSKSYLPFLEKSITMQMVSGRHAVNSSSTIINPMVILANHMPEAEKLKIAKLVMEKYGVERFKNVGSLSLSRFMNGPSKIKELKEFAEYAALIEVSEGQNYSDDIYYNMDKSVHRYNNLTAALSMSSSRIEKYESLGTQNTKGWYTGDGMLCLYTDDTSQYTTTYFSSVDPYHMPGTTVDSTVRKEISTSSDPDWGLPDNDWAGGVTNGRDSVQGLQLGNKFVSGLKGNKSYFMFGDRIVCVGSAVEGGKGEVYTVVDNRFITKENENAADEDVAIKVEKIRDYNGNKEETLNLLIDSDFATGAAFENIGGWYDFDLGSSKQIGTIAVAFNYGNQRKTKFDVLVSNDGEDYKEAGNVITGGKTQEFEMINFECTGRYIRIVSQGNTTNNWFNLRDIKFYSKDTSKNEINESITRVLKGYNDLYVNGDKKEVVFNTPDIIKNPESLWYDGGMGYVFLDKESDLKVYREAQGLSTAFMRLSVLHGENPSNGKYAYVMLPYRSFEETNAYVENPDVELIENSKEYHIVKDLKTGITGANLFKKGTVGEFEFSSPCSVMLDEKNTKIYLAEPTQKLSEIIITVPENIKVKKSPYIKVNGKQITVDMSALGRGASYEVDYDNVFESSNISVLDYNIKYTEATVKTKLNAYSKDGGKLEYSIYSHPENGTAKLIGDVLWYYPGKNITNDSIVINVRNENGEEAMFNVNLISGR